LVAQARESGRRGLTATRAAAGGALPEILSATCERALLWQTSDSHVF